MANILEQFSELRTDSVDYDFRSTAHVAAAEGQLSCIKFLCEYAYRVHRDLSWIRREDCWEFSPIEQAYLYGHNDVANYLSECIKSNKSMITSNQKHIFKIKPIIASMCRWKVVLHFETVASNNEKELIEHLLASVVFLPSDLYVDYDGQTPMYLAAANVHLDVIKVLQRSRYDEKTQNQWGDSALNEVRRKKINEIIDILIDDIF